MSTPDSLPRITRLRVQNFRSIADIDVPLGPLTVLVGPNGSGKSNVVDALRFMRDALTRGLDQALRDRDGIGAVRRWTGAGRPRDIEIMVAISNAGETITYGFGLAGSTSHEYEVRWETLALDAFGPNPEVFDRAPKRPFLENGVPRPLRGGVHKHSADQLLGPMDLILSNFGRASQIISQSTSKAGSDLDIFFHSSNYRLDGSLFYDLHLRDLRQPQRLVHEAPLDEHGQNLAAVLRGIRRSMDGGADDIRLVLRRLAEGVEDFSVQTVGGYLVTRLHYTGPGGKTRKSDLSQESDGTVRMLGLLAALYQQPAPPLIAIEEPEANIHPGALGVLAGVLDQASTRGQVLVTTHSPELLDQLPPESFLVVEKVNGETKVGPLSTTQVEAVRQRLFSPGELLRMEGLEREPDADATHAAS